MNLIHVHLVCNGRYWQARWRDHLGRQHAKGLGSRAKITRRAAQHRVDLLQLELNSGRTEPGDAPALRDYAERYLRNRPRLAPGTVELYRQTIRYLLAYFGDAIRMDQITPADAADWRAALERGELAGANRRMRGVPSEPTVCRSVREAKAIFQAATREGLLLRNPFVGLRGTPPRPEKRWFYVSRELLWRLVDASPSIGWQLLLALCRLAGLRQGEALRLRWEHVDFETRRLWVVSKRRYRTTKDACREVPIDPDLYRLLVDAYARASSELSGPRVIPPESLPKQNHLWKGFRSLCQRAGVPAWKRWCHTLRKNAEMDWMQRFDPYTVCQWLGHSPEVAATYYHRVKDSDFERAAQPALVAKPS